MERHRQKPSNKLMNSHDKREGDREREKEKEKDRGQKTTDSPERSLGSGKRETEPARLLGARVLIAAGQQLRKVPKMIWRVKQQSHQKRSGM